MDSPAPKTLMRALEVLNYLGALDDDGNLTKPGRPRKLQMKQKPGLDTLMGSPETAECTPCIQAKWALTAADNLRQQLVSIMARFNLKLCSTEFNSRDYYVNIRKAMLAGWFTYIHPIALTTSQNGLYTMNTFIDIAPHYYDLVNFPNCEAKRVLARLYKKQVEKEGRAR
ncbi:hypothetical protein Ancab_022523 [Ancistrocladus abbreviatus]